MLFEFSYSDFTFKNCLMATRLCLVAIEKDVLQIMNAFYYAHLTINLISLIHFTRRFERVHK